MDGGGERHAAAGQLLRVDQHVVRVQRVRHGRRALIADTPAGEGVGFGRRPSGVPAAVSIVRTTWDDPRSVAFRTLLDDEMHERYTGRHDDDPDFAEKADAAFAVDGDTVIAVLLAVQASGSAVGHAVLRRTATPGRVEVKKVVVAPTARGSGVGRMLMAAVEQVARDLQASLLVLQTGDRQPDAVAMYEALGFHRVPTFEPYVPITNSICFEKPLG